MKKVKGLKGEKVKGEGLNNTFNNPGLLLKSLCFAEMSVWDVYDEITVQRSKNELILTRREKNAIADSATALLEVWLNLSKIVERRMKAETFAKEGGAR